MVKNSFIFSVFTTATYLDESIKRFHLNRKWKNKCLPADSRHADIRCPLSQTQKSAPSLSGCVQEAVRGKRSSDWPNAPALSQMWLLCRLMNLLLHSEVSDCFCPTFISSLASQVSKPHDQQILSHHTSFFINPKHLAHIPDLVSSCPESLMEDCFQREQSNFPCSSCFSCWNSALACRFRRHNIHSKMLSAKNTRL